MVSGKPVTAIHLGEHCYVFQQEKLNFAAFSYKGNVYWQIGCLYLNYKVYGLKMNIVFLIKYCMEQLPMLWLNIATYQIP